jgi:chemotaxis protein methyltransferase CheR
VGGVVVLEQKRTEELTNYLENSAYEKVKRMIGEKAGLNCSGYRDEYLKRRFEIRLRATGSDTYARYIIYLNKHPEEFTNLLNDLTINYTTFFRDSDVYEYLEHKLLPKLFLSKLPVKIWSAGCATGEEPYSLAILIHKLLGKRLAEHPVSIIASDIDKDALAKAQRGAYGPRQVSTISTTMMSQFFEKEGDLSIVKDFVKDIVHFERFDLMKTSVHSQLDLILCRNVMIYFSKEGQQHIHMSFYHALKDGGYMITGKSEILSGEPAEKFQALDYVIRLYQRPMKPAFEPMKL